MERPFRFLRLVSAIALFFYAYSIKTLLYSSTYPLEITPTLSKCYYIVVLIR